MMVSPKATLFIAALGVMLARWFVDNSHHKSHKNVCEGATESVVWIRPFFFFHRRDDMVTLTAETTDACHVFSDTYQEARAKFRDAAHGIAGCELHSLSVQEKDNYTIDIAVLPGNLPGLTVHTSGVHGVEGYAGSAVQIAFLEAILASTNTTTSTTTKKPAVEGPLELELPTMMFVHAYNPVGMAHYRRTNEHNVDLNRNALTTTEWKTYAAHHYNRANYERFDTHLFNPARAPTLFSSAVEFWVRALLALQQHGLSTLKAAMVGGQYHQPTGIFYGGSGEIESSTRLVETFLKEYLSQHKILSQQTVTWIDVHTGLGKSGEDTLMSRPESSIWPEKDPAQEFSEWFPDSVSPFDASSAAATTVAQGYKQVKGITADYFETSLFTADQKPLLIAQEFGTQHMVLVGHALVIENMAHHYCDTTDDAIQWAQRTTRRAFYPDSALWRQQVLERGLRALVQATKRSSQLSKVSKVESVESEQEQPVPDADEDVAELSKVKESEQEQPELEPDETIAE
jgi:hypothetical protein